jgi:eukaryotic-like serine/threonine-protein kinase
MTEVARELKEQVGPYRLIRAIGAGGSARIDLARIERAYNFQRHVVVKRPLEHLRGDPQVAASLRREARIGGRLRHPNLVAVLDAGMHDGYDYLVLEYIHGTSLRTLMQTEVGARVREVPIAVALGIAIDVARGLHDAHELNDESGSPLGLVHRDVSPGNVLLGLDGAVKLADFGIAKETRVATLSGSMHGTVTYMAPEQCRGHAFDRRADIFSIGVIFYELVTKQRLFWADNDVASLHRVLSGQVTPPRKIDAAISKPLEDIVMMAVAQDPQGRFGTAREFADALEALAAAEGHVIGARWIARTLEEVIGAKHAPWIPATTAVEPLHALPAGDAWEPATLREDEPAPEPSLVAVIEATAADAEPIDPAFGPHDPRVFEEGEVPSSPVVTARPQTAAKPRRRPWLVPAGVLAVGGGIAIGLIVATSNSETPPPRPPPLTRPALPPVHEVAPPALPPVQDTVQGTVGSDDIAIEPVDTTKPNPARRRHHHQTTTAHVGSGTGSAVSAPIPTPVDAGVAPLATGSGSGTKGPSEWKPDIFLPTDVGSNKRKNSP